MKKLLYLVLFLLSGQVVHGAAICDDLATFACSPGSFNDGTGSVKSEIDVQSEMSQYSNTIRPTIEAQVRELLARPENDYFKRMSLAALGLQNSPACNSTSAAIRAQCEIAQVQGLTMLVMKASLGSILPTGALRDIGDMENVRYILNDQHFGQLMENVYKKAHDDLISPERVAKVKDKVFPKVKDLIIERLRQMHIPQDKLSMMISKVSSITFEGTKCTAPASNGMTTTSKPSAAVAKPSPSTVNSLLVPNAHYSPESNTFAFCDGYLLQSDSEFQMATSVAHELAHSIDPCGLSCGPTNFALRYHEKIDLNKLQDEYPIQNVLQCLRSDRSVGARNFTDEANRRNALINQQNENQYKAFVAQQAQYQAQYRAQMAQSAQNASGTSRAQAGPLAGGGQAPPSIPMTDLSFCNDDQMGESFADWLSSEVVPEYISRNHQLTAEQYQLGYANARRMICSHDPEGGNIEQDVHPPMVNRINRIILLNPKVRSQMGCPARTPAGTVYCDPNRTFVAEPARAVTPGFGTAAGTLNTPAAQPSTTASPYVNPYASPAPAGGNR